MRSSLAKPCSYKCSLHQQLECKLIQTREGPWLLFYSHSSPLHLFYLVLICVFLCFPCRDPIGSRWIPHLQPQYLWQDLLALTEHFVAGAIPDSKFIARNHEDGLPPTHEDEEAMKKNRMQYLFFTSQSRIQTTQLAHVASLYDLTSFSHPFRYVSCIQVSIAVIDSD